VKRTTITLPDPLESALAEFQRDQAARASTSAVIQAAIQEFLERRGYGTASLAGAFHITPASPGSGTADASVEHDRDIAAAAHP
jgi:Arc/MetJ-type ribon-helix-helix transcriptional regulator